MYENFLRRMAAYHDIEISEEQAEQGQVKDARLALEEMKIKYVI